MSSIFTEFNLMQELHQKGGKIVLLVMDGLGGLPMQAGGQDRAGNRATRPIWTSWPPKAAPGLSIPIRPGIEPGSGPAHLSLFSYDPVKYEIGRGVLEALGIGFELRPNDIAARGNFATADADGVITDRRAGRISTEECIRLTAQAAGRHRRPVPRLRSLRQAGQGASFCLCAARRGLGRRAERDRSAGDGQEAAAGGRRQRHRRRRKHRRPGQPVGRRRTRGVGRRTQGQQPQPARAGQGPRSAPLSAKSTGCAPRPSPSIPCTKAWPGWWAWTWSTSRASARNMRSRRWRRSGTTTTSSSSTSRRPTATARTATSTPKFTRSRRSMPSSRAFWRCKPGALIVTGDHSTPAKLRSHSWHPVPTLLWSPTAMPDTVTTFGERACSGGYLGASTPPP